MESWDPPISMPQKKNSETHVFSSKKYRGAMIIPSRERIHIPPNEKFGKSSTQKWLLMGYVIVPWRVSPFYNESARGLIFKDSEINPWKFQPLLLLISINLKPLKPPIHLSKKNGTFLCVPGQKKIRRIFRRSKQLQNLYLRALTQIHMFCG